ncbi:N/A [soil metagenome]
MIHILNKILPSVRSGYMLLKKNDPLILSSSTAFFMTFSLSPILIILTDLLTPILGKETVHKELFSKIQEALGSRIAKDVHTIVDGFEAHETSLLLTILSTVFLYFVATTLLAVIKQAIHQIWSIKKKESTQGVYYLKERLTGIALMFLVAVLTAISYLMGVIESSFNNNQLLVSFISVIFSLIIIVTFFTMLLKYLPEALVRWPIALAGGTFTGILFNSGVFILGKVLVHKQIASIFGVSTSIAILLLFIFYCSFILYLGVSFTYELGKGSRRPIEPGIYSIEFKKFQN